MYTLYWGGEGVLTNESVLLCCSPLHDMHKTGEIQLRFLFLLWPTVWNWLPLSLQSVSTFEAFQSGLTSHLFEKHLAQLQLLFCSFLNSSSMHCLLWCYLFANNYVYCMVDCQFVYSLLCAEHWTRSHTGKCA